MTRLKTRIQWCGASGLFLCAAFLPPTSANADAVVTRCTVDNEAMAGDLNSALLAGGHITFDCPAGTTIRILTRHGIAKPTQIDGGGGITLDGGRSSGMFDVSDSLLAFSLTGLTIKNAIPSGGSPGSVVSGRGMVTITKSTITGSDGAVNLGVGSFTAADTDFLDGKGVAISAPTVDLTRTRIHGVGVQPIVSVAGQVAIRDSEINATGSSVFDSCKLLILNTTIQSSLTTAVISGCDTTISASKFTGNHGDTGGALFLKKTAFSLNIRGGSFVGNSAAKSGGAVSLEPCETADRVVKFQDVVFQNNTAAIGGAVFLGGFIENNILLEGHALVFAGNQASTSGGAIAGTNVRLQLARALFVGNSAVTAGGAIDLSQFGIRPSMIVNSVFTRNRAPDGSVFRGAETQFVNDSIVANQDGPAIVGQFQMVGPAPEPWRLTTFHNTALVGNTPSSCTSDVRSKLVVEGGNNLQFPASGCPPTIPVADPQFDSMFVPAWGSPAIGAGDLNACVAPPVGGADLYGRHRPQGKTCTIGAVEGDIEDLVRLRYPKYNNLPKTPPATCPCPPSTTTTAPTSGTPPDTYPSTGPDGTSGTTSVPPVSPPYPQSKPPA